MLSAGTYGIAGTMKGNLVRVESCCWSFNKQTRAITDKAAVSCIARTLFSGVYHQLLRNTTHRPIRASTRTPTKFLLTNVLQRSFGDFGVLESVVAG